jgi:hypothetical protein
MIRVYKCSRWRITHYLFSFFSQRRMNGKGKMEGRDITVRGDENKQNAATECRRRFREMLLYKHGLPTYRREEAYVSDICKLR